MTRKTLYGRLGVLCCVLLFIGILESTTAMLDFIFPYVVSLSAVSVAITGASVIRFMLNER